MIHRDDSRSSQMETKGLLAAQFLRNGGEDKCDSNLPSQTTPQTLIVRSKLARLTLVVHP